MFFSVDLESWTDSQAHEHHENISMDLQQIPH